MPSIILSLKRGSGMGSHGLCKRDIEKVRVIHHMWSPGKFLTLCPKTLKGGGVSGGGSGHESGVISESDPEKEEPPKLHNYA